MSGDGIATCIKRCEVVEYGAEGALLLAAASQAWHFFKTTKSDEIANITGLPVESVERQAANLIRLGALAVDEGGNLIPVGAEETATISEPKETDRSGWVYVMAHDVARGPYKVGRSTNVENRRRQIERSSGMTAHVLHSWMQADCHAAEAAMHESLDGWRGYGEWFGCDLNVVLAAADSIGLVRPT